MSKNLFFIRLALGFLFLALLMNVIACDPCYELGRSLCECEETEEKRKECLAGLSLAKSDNFFKKASNPKLCQAALEECGSCKAVKEGKDGKCGSYSISLTGQEGK
ncbi:MAG: hypothetical protein KC505_04075 [Myxococcales bacterium]|nr:hypothetical protein [Myxococcales bacterium]USN49956.1 MAG: hypothetical protein H6731_06680 [Myxococcales bacterium]